MPEGDNSMGLEKIIKFGNIFQAQSVNTANTLFGDMPVMEIPPPKIPDCPRWSLTEQLDHEKEVTGMFISGHPLDHFRFENTYYGIMRLSDFNDFKQSVELHPHPTQVIRLACLVTSVQHRISQRGSKYGILSLEDFSGKTELTLFGEAYVKYLNYFEPGTCLYLTGKFEKWEKRNEWNFKVVEICLLETIKKTMTRALEMSIMGELLKEDVVTFLVNNIKKNPGNSRVKFKVIEPKHNWNINLVSMAKGLEVNDELSAFLMDNPYIDVNVVTANGN